MMISHKRPGWESLLTKFVRDYQLRPFEWVTNDCGTVAFDWVEIATGERLWRPPYTDVMSAGRYIAENGGVGSILTGILGDPIGSPRLAQRGDIALLSIEGRESAAIVVGHQVVGPGEHGLVHVPRTEIVKAWRV